MIATRAFALAPHARGATVREAQQSNQGLLHTAAAGRLPEAKKLRYMREHTPKKPCKKI